MKRSKPLLAAKRGLEWTRDALVEQDAGATSVYGRWDRFFGCWQTDSNGRNVQSFVPRWCLLDEAGQQAHVSWNDTRCDRADLLHRFISLIPTEIRHVAAPFGSWQWLVLSMISDVPAFADFLKVELNSVGPGFVASCFALARADEMSRSGRITFCHRILYEKRTRIVSSLVGKCHAAMLVSWLGKLDIDATELHLVDLLVELAEDKSKAETISHLSLITPRVIQWASSLPLWVCSVNLLNAMQETRPGDNASSFDDLLSLVQFVEWHCPDRVNAVGTSLRSAKGRKHLDALVDSWNVRLVDAMPFPSAPMRQSGRLQPLTTARMMREEARRMRNCIGSMTWQVVRGDIYFYRWDGAEPATISLTKDGHKRWQLAKALGFDNDPLSNQTAIEIEEFIRGILPIKTAPNI